MKMVDLIVKKRDGAALSAEEITWMIDGYVAGSIPDYQMSAMLMAIVLKGMNVDETVALTKAMLYSGETLDLSPINGIKGDKHSTGGVGDKTSLVLCPMVAACGMKIAKMSGRGLGHTGGTIDKLESFPGFSTGISEELFFNNVNSIGIAIAGQTADLDPADKKLYALRDVTGTVSSVPLIVSSIMSKKLAAGADVIVLDVKCGDGSFMKTEAQAEELAENLVTVGIGAGKKCAAVITDMEQPLGYAVGNALEVKEAIATLRGDMEGDLLDLCLTIGSRMLTLAGLADDAADAAAKLIKTIHDGSALRKLARLVEAQGGDPASVYDVSMLPKAPVQMEVLSEASGFVQHIAAENVGLISLGLGGGRATKEDEIDLSVGLVLNKKVGDKVEKGEKLAVIHAKTRPDALAAAEQLKNCYAFSQSPVERSRFIKKIL